MAYRTYTGKDIDVQYSLKHCIHAAECVNRLRAVFDTEKKPWIQPDEADAKSVADVIHRCPSGALRYESHDKAVADEVPDTINTIQLVDHGPLYVRGDMVLHLADETPSESRLALCRCGNSENKPYCDNSHLRIEFEAQTTLAKIESSTTDSPGKLDLKPYANGPIGVRGRFQLLNAAGEVVMESTNATLCRCGASQNKPFCDGTHQKIDFRTP